MIRLEAIRFNHDPGSATHDAMNIRRNAGLAVGAPEWQRGVSVRPEDSPAAYALTETRGHELSIQAQFSSAVTEPTWAEIRAVQKGSGDVLGTAGPTRVQFLPKALTKFEAFRLEHTKLAARGVAAADQHWDWQYRREPDDGWRTFGRSGHRIYTVLSVPTLPWVQQPATPINAGLPWTDVLEYACGWAHGAHTADEAARGVTEGVFALGPHVVTYDCPGGGASHYSALGFDCTSFLDRLRGGPGSGQYVNCSDCATFVSTFANVLGCDLWQSRMGWGFALNPILAIGSAQWQTACGWPSFNYHEVAWEGDCGADDDVFDGCLEVDGDANPAGPPHHGLLPCDLRFGQVGDMQYRDRLATATPGGSANCQPQPGTRLRRTVF